MITRNKIVGFFYELDDLGKIGEIANNAGLHMENTYIGVPGGGVCPIGIPFFWLLEFEDTIKVR